MKRLLLFLLLSLSVSISFPQNFQKTLQDFNGAFVSERIHVHFDKTSYVPGDTVWFKAYVMEGTLPTSRSKTFYADWTDATGKIVFRTSAPIVGGTTFGQMAVPENYSSAYLHMRAYTRWMLNFDSSFLCDRDIRILSAAGASIPSPALRYSINFFPEGGSLIEGVSSKLAFKATDQFGRPASVSGQVIVGSVEKSKFQSKHDGMGYFMMMPERGKKYSVTWKDPAGQNHTAQLPSALPKGVALQISDSEAGKVFMVRSTDPSVSSIHILGSMHQQIVFNTPRILTEGITQGTIPIKSLPSGTLTVTVLDEAYQPLAERITFVNNHEYVFPAEMTVQHWGLNKRARNEIEISIPGGLVANLSVSVTDNSIDFDTSRSIVSDLMLSSELKGPIHNPVYYFSGADSADKMLDLVMLTHGWRKILWTELAAGKLPEIHQPADTGFVTITGKIYGALPSQLANAGDVLLIVNQENKSELVSGKVNRDGSFEVPDFMLFDTATVYFQPPPGSTLQNVSVQFMQDRLVAQSRHPAGRDSYLQGDTSGAARHSRLAEAYLDELKFFQGKVLEDITITARGKSAEEVLDETYASGLFSGGSGKGFDLRDAATTGSYLNIFQFLQGRVAGLTVTPGNPPGLSYRGGSPALFFNEMPVDADMLATVPVTDIAYVKVMQPPFVGAAGGGANGAIAIYTKKGGDMQTESRKGLSKNTIGGYSVIRQFYSPDYERMRGNTRDLRTTLYWNPEVLLTPDNRSAMLRFFNNDVTEAFRVVIEGMTSDGRITRTIQVME